MSSWFGGWGAPSSDTIAAPGRELAATGEGDAQADPDAAADNTFTAGLWSVADRIQEVGAAVKDYVEDKLEDAKDVVMESAVGPQIKKFNEATQRFEEHVEHWMKGQIIAELEVILDKLPTIIKTSMNQDPDMIQFVWKRICRLIDKSWPDIRVELLNDIEEQLGLKEPLEKNIVTEQTDEQRCGCGLLAYLRYCLEPFDRSFWGKIKSPIWIMMTFVMLVPVTYVSGLSFLFFFLVIDKQDEYQLCNFILVNKNCQFLSQGLIRLFVGYFQYLDCVTAVARDDMHRCADRGPGQWGPIWLVLSGWSLQIALSWLACLLLPCTAPHHAKMDEELKKSHGLWELFSKETAKEEEEDKASPLGAPEQNAMAALESMSMLQKHKEQVRAAREKFHRRSSAVMSHIGSSDKKNLRRMIIYDAAVTALVVGIVAWQIVVADDINSFVVRQVIYTGQCAYGVMCLPFAIFSLPFVQRVLLHCHRTGYDVLGNCRFYIGAVKPEKRPPAVSVGSATDHTSLFGKVMGAISGGESHVTADVHEYVQCSAARPVKCVHCAKKMTHPRAQAQKCKYCRATFCSDCCTIAEPCNRAKKVHEKEAKRNALEAKNKEGEDAIGATVTRYETFTSLWSLSTTVMKAIGSVDGSSESVEQFKKVMKAALRKASNKHIEVMVDRVPVLLKWMMADDDMPLLIADAKDKAIDTFWLDLREEILYQCQAALSPPVTTNERDLHPGVDCFRAKIRHNQYPYNRSIFWQVKQPVWWALRLISLIPWGGVLPLVFLFIFIITDKTDEFQLVQFILLFKGTQFISHGIIKTAIGFFTYVGCTAKASEDWNKFDHHCEISGPGVTAGWRVFEIMLGGWVLQILLVWTAFFMLPCSSDKARADIKEVDADVQEALQDYEAESDDDVVNGPETKHSKKTHAAKSGGWSAGGKIRYLLIWDMVAFLASVSVMVWIMTTRPSFDWVVVHTFFACQVVYGYLAVPFFIFSIPMLRDALTHSVPSAYDEQGRVRALEAPPNKDPEVLKAQLEWLEQERKKAHPEEVDEDGENDFGLGELMHKFKGMILGMFGFAEEEEEKGKEVKEDGGSGYFKNLKSGFHMPTMTSAKTGDKELVGEVKTTFA